MHWCIHDVRFVFDSEDSGNVHSNDIPRKSPQLLRRLGLRHAEAEEATLGGVPPSPAQLSMPQRGYGSCITSGDCCSATIQQLHVTAELLLDIRYGVRKVCARNGGKTGHFQRVDVTIDLFSERAAECRRSRGFPDRMMEKCSVGEKDGGISILRGRETVP